MELSPQQLCEVEFSEQWRGYSRDQVDDFIERVAAAVSTLQDRLRKMTERAVRAEQRAQEGSDADGAARRTLVLAQRTADATIAEAKETAARLIAQAQEEARALVLAAEAAAEATPPVEPTAREEIADLEVTRSRLQANVAALEAHVTDNRARIKGLLDELQLRVDEGLSPHIDQWPTFDNGRVLVTEDVVDREVVDALVDEALNEPEADSDYDPDPQPLFEAEHGVEEAIEDEVPSDVEDELEPAPSEEWQAVNLDWETPQVLPAPVPAVDESEWERGDDLAVRVPSQPADEFSSHEVDDDTYFAELRGALDDDAPLGPRDDGGDSAASREQVATAVDDGPRLYDQGRPDGRKSSLLRRRKRR